MTCSNCEKPIPASDRPLSCYQGTHLVSSICEACQAGTLTVKVVLSRPRSTGRFEYEGYLPVACERTV